MRLLHPPDRVDLGLKVDSLDAAEEAARLVRHRLGQPAEPIIDLADAGERLGLYAFVLELDAPVEGAYVALERGGVALIQGREPVGKRRFTLAHELGHHVLQDAYSTEWVPGNRDERERLINALAIHFLAPRPGIAARWEALDGPKDPRNAAIFVAAEFGVSWSAMCGHLRNLGLIPEGRREELSLSAPTRLEQLERGLVLTAQPGPRTLPRAFTAAVALGFRRQLLGRVRALEMLRGVLDEGDLPREPSVPLDALLGDIEST